MKKLRDVVAILITVLIFGALTAFGAFAIEKNNILSAVKVSPMYQKVTLAPGESKELSIKITNPGNSQRDLQYSISTGPFNQNGDTIDIGSITSHNQIMDWIDFEKETGVIAPNGVEILNFTINVPESAPAGGQYATIIVQDDTSRNTSGGSNVNIESVAQIISIIYAEITGDTVGTGVVLENNLPSMIFNNKLEATSLVKNTGNVHTDAKYTLQVWPIFSDEEICTNEENPGTNLIMPEMERYYTQSCNLPIVGIFRAKQTVQIFDEVSFEEKIVVVCPLWLLTIIVIVIVALIVWLVARSKARKRKMEEN